MTAKPVQPTFTDAVTELETIVNQLRGNAIPLELAMAQFERGVALVQVCQTTLKQATGKLEQLTETMQLVPLDA